MAPCCGCYGPLSHLNWSINYETMLAKYNNGSKVARFCGKVALLQLNKHLDFLCEQPDPSDLFREGDWPQVMRRPGVEQVKYDRCMCHLQVSRGPFIDLYIRKPSTMTTELGDPFRNLKCLGRHAHLQGIGHGKEHSQAQVWTHNEAKRVILGITKLLKRSRTGYTQAYPTQIDRSTIARATPGGAPELGKRDERAPPAGNGSPCQGCRWRRGRTDVAHNRKVGECGYPYDEPIIPDCDACLNNKSRWTADHTYLPGQCKWASAETRRGSKRKGAHPTRPTSIYGSP